MATSSTSCSTSKNRRINPGSVLTPDFLQTGKHFPNASAFTGERQKKVHPVEDAVSFFFLCCCPTLSGRKGRGKPAAAHCFGRKPAAFFRLNMQQSPAGTWLGFENRRFKECTGKVRTGPADAGGKRCKSPRRSLCSLCASDRNRGRWGPWPRPRKAGRRRTGRISEYWRWA